MNVSNRIYKSELVEWRLIKDLQPELVKNTYNISYLRESILKYGVSKAFDVCEIDGEIYFMDGHTRSNMFETLESEGVRIPDKLMCNFCQVESKEEAIRILLEVHNQKQNPFIKSRLEEWLELEDIEVEDIKIESINIELIEIDKPIDKEPRPQKNTTAIKLEYTQEEYDYIQDVITRHRITPERIFYDAIKNL
jgi:hypothetical protein